MIICGADIETTGLDQAAGHRIVEVAFVLIDADTRVEKGRWVQRINPGRPIDAGAQAVHGISFEQVAMCPTWEEVGPKVARILSAVDVVVAHNGDGFDRPFIENELKRIGIAVPTRAQWFDTMLHARWATPMGKMPKLSELCFACGVNYDPALAHAAEYDVQVMLNAFFAAFDKGFFNTEEAA